MTEEVVFEQTWRELLVALRESGAARVWATYSGAGDEGYIDECVLYDHRGEPIRQGSERVFNGANELVNRVMEFIDLCIDTGGHSGYEINEGGGGKCEIDVERGTIRLEHYDTVEDQIYDTTAWDQEGHPVDLPAAHYCVIRCVLTPGLTGEAAAQEFLQIVAQISERDAVQRAVLETTGEAFQ